MKEFDYAPHDKAHEGEVSKLVYANTHKAVISVSWDKTVCVHDEMDPDKGVLLRQMRGTATHHTTSTLTSPSTLTTTLSLHFFTDFISHPNLNSDFNTNVHVISYFISD